MNILRIELSYYQRMNLSAVGNREHQCRCLTFHTYCLLLLVSAARLMPRSQRSAGCAAAAASPAPANLIFDPLNAGLAGHQAPAHRG